MKTEIDFHSIGSYIFFSYLLNKTTYKEFPISIVNKVIEQEIQPLLIKVNKKKVYKYFQKQDIKLTEENLNTYYLYRFLLQYDKDYINQLYWMTKKLHHVLFGEKITNRVYPKNFEEIVNTIAVLKEMHLLKNDLTETLKYEVDIYFNDNHKKQIETYFKRKLYGDYTYNLYAYNYDEDILFFLKKYERTFKMYDKDLLEKFYKETNLKLKYKIEDDYRTFYFDRYGIIATDIYDVDIYYALEYNKADCDYNKISEDYDILVHIKIAHIDEDQDGVYIELEHSKPDPYYEDRNDSIDEDYICKPQTKLYIFKPSKMDSVTRVREEVYGYKDEELR